MVGSAVATIVWSRAASSIPSAKPEKITRTWRFVYVRGGSSAIHGGRVHHRVRVFEDVPNMPPVGAARAGRNLRSFAFEGPIWALKLRRTRQAARLQLGPCHLAVGPQLGTPL